MYQFVPIRYVLRIDEEGQRTQLIDSATSELKRGKERMAPDRSNRTNKDCPLLFADHAEYTLGMPRPGKSVEDALRRHALYRQLVQDCAQATGEPAVEAILHFLHTIQPGQPSFPLPEDFRPGERITFEVLLRGGQRVWPIDLISVQNFWAQTMAVGDATQRLECLVCGKERPPVASLPTQIRGIPGDQATVALISANDDAFESYGLEHSRIAPLCEVCAHEVCSALNALLRQRETHIRGRALAYVFWAAEASALPFGSMILEADPTEVHAFLTTPWRGQNASLETAAFHAAALSSNRSRLVVRDWLETTLASAGENLRRYFRLQRMVNRFGEPRWFPLWQLVKATERPGTREKLTPRVEAALIHCAFHGGSLPQWLLCQVLQCVQAAQIRTVEGERGMQPAQAALLKMILLSQTDHSWLRQETLSEQEREDMLVELDLNCPDRAYLCGRLFAVLEEIEGLAMGSISNDIGGYFHTASSAPAVVFASLLQRAHPHLATLAKKIPGAAYRLDTQIQDILILIPAREAFPETLWPLEQGRFALGYYQQKAASRQAATQAAAKKATPPQPIAPALEAGGN